MTIDRRNANTFLWRFIKHRIVELAEECSLSTRVWSTSSQRWSVRRVLTPRRRVLTLRRVTCSAFLMHRCPSTLTTDQHTPMPWLGCLRAVASVHNVLEISKREKWPAERQKACKWWFSVRWAFVCNDLVEKDHGACSAVAFVWTQSERTWKWKIYQNISVALEHSERILIFLLLFEDVEFLQPNVFDDKVQMRYKWGRCSLIFLSLAPAGTEAKTHAFDLLLLDLDRNFCQSFWRTCSRFGLQSASNQRSSRLVRSFSTHTHVSKTPTCFWNTDKAFLAGNTFAARVSGDIPAFQNIRRKNNTMSSMHTDQLIIISSFQLQCADLKQSGPFVRLSFSPKTVGPHWCCERLFKLLLCTSERRCVRVYLMHSLINSTFNSTRINIPYLTLPFTEKRGGTIWSSHDMYFEAFMVPFHTSDSMALGLMMWTHIIATFISQALLFKTALVTRPANTIVHTNRNWSGHYRIWIYSQEGCTLIWVLVLRKTVFTTERVKSGFEFQRGRCVVDGRRELKSPCGHKCPEDHDRCLCRDSQKQTWAPCQGCVSNNLGLWVPHDCPTGTRKTLLENFFSESFEHFS